MSMRIPVIIDTDIGDDIDDAFALCLAMQSPEIEILGVTTVFKNTRARAMIAKKLLTLGGYPDIPVAAGASIPLSNPEMFGKPVDFEELPKSYRPEYETELDLVHTGMELIITILENSSEPARAHPLPTPQKSLRRNSPALSSHIWLIRCFSLLYKSLK